MKLIGQIEDGKGDAAFWLKKYSLEYQRKLGVKIYPGSLNIKLPNFFYFRQDDLAAKLIDMDKSEYGGERNILMLPCLIFQKNAFLWRTQRAEDGMIANFDYSLVEIITNIHLRSSYNLANGQLLEIDL